jgi:putative AlgH/UPF0301 family transcriptional regulator
MPSKSYLGHLLAANPSNPRDSLSNTVILVCSNTPRLTFGLQVNQPLPDLTVGEIISGLGLYHESEQPIYHGGNLKTEKIHVVHSTDWMGMTSQNITPDLAITSDISVLTAMCAGEGPTQFRACAGFWAWEPGTLERQMDPKSTNVNHRWESVPATPELIFDQPSQDHWHNILAACVQHQTSMLF